jgi:streptogramin lyase
LSLLRLIVGGHQTVDLGGKRLDLLREIVPGLLRLAMMANVGNPANVSDMHELQAAAWASGLDATMFEIRSTEDIAGLYITDSGNNRVLKLAAVGGTPTPLLTSLNSPSGVTVDSAGNLYIIDSGNNQVLKLAAGTATPTPLLTGLNKPAGLAVDGAGNLYIIDTGNNQVLKLAAGATTPTPLLTGLNNPTDVAVDNAGNLYITDTGNSRVLMLPAG